MFRIGLFSKLNKVSIKTLRYYDNKGLLKPAHTDEDNGYRYYSAEQMVTLNKIIGLKELDFSLDEIAFILKEDVGFEQMLELKMLECQQRITLDNERLKKMELLKVQLEEAEKLSYDIIIKESQEMLVATLRDDIPTYSEQGPLWVELSEYIEAQGAKIGEPCMIVYHDDSEGRGSIDAEIIEPIIGTVTPSDRIQVKKMPAGEKLVSVIHKGSYDHLYMAYKEAMTWITENNYETTGPERELYLKGEWNSKDVSEYVTELNIPVKKK